MGFNVEMNNYLLHKDEEKIVGYFAGDNIICEAEGKRYVGKIASIGYYREEEGAEPKPAIYIDTTKGRKAIPAKSLCWMTLHTFIMIRQNISLKQWGTDRNTAG